MQITLELPEDIAAHRAAKGENLPREHGIELEYTEEDLEHDRETHRNLENRHPQTSLVQENGLLVHVGKAPQPFNWDRIVDEQREERIREVSGL